VRKADGGESARVHVAVYTTSRGGGAETCRQHEQAERCAVAGGAEGWREARGGGADGGPVRVDGYCFAQPE
jgi:hypothetical protein